jgi:hypothetical protein
MEIHKKIRRHQIVMMVPMMVLLPEATALSHLMAEG